MKILNNLNFILTMLGSSIGMSLTAQALPIDPSVTRVVIEPSSGNLEFVINGDVDADGNRVNPNRVYVLQAGKAYVQESAITFGGDLDTNATLNIVGEEGGPLPVIIMNPGADVGAFANRVNGSLTIKNVYWGIANANNQASGLFLLVGSDKRLILENMVSENAFNGDAFSLRSVMGEADVYIKNCYFRDFSQLSNSWNYSVVARGDNGEAFDTLWVENTTITHSGMPFFGKFNSVNFAFFNHNTFVNIPKYPVWMERYKEAYFTNNLFINANYEGECKSTYTTQIGEDFIPSGLINIDTVEADWFTPSVSAEDVIFYASDNLNYRSPFLDKYWAGGYNNVADHPISNRVWGDVTNDEAPLQVFPVPLYNERTLKLAENYENIIIERSYENVDPQMVTPGIKDQKTADEYAAFMRGNYGVAEAGETWDREMMYFGDANAMTIPGNEGKEDGFVISSMADIPEDFSYNADILSAIDQKHLGSLAWYPSELASYDSDAALLLVKEQHPVGINNIFNSVKSSLKVYPNPTSHSFRVAVDAEVLNVFNALGQLVISVNEYRLGQSISVEQLNKGIYFISDGIGTTKLIVE